jgi:SAM-dependent methyltransferase
MNERPERYIPVLRFQWLTALYDPLLRWTMREKAFKERLVRQAAITAGQRVLDLGAGTGTLTLLIKRLFPGAVVEGIDGDAAVLAIARDKASRAGLDVTFARGLSFDLPYPDSSFDRVLSSLLFHHLTHDQKERSLREALRVLRPGGELHVVDWGPAANPLLRAAFLLVQLLDGFATTRDNAAGKLPELFRAAGFVDVEQTARFATPFGALALYQARKPVS